MAELAVVRSNERLLEADGEVVWWCRVSAVPTSFYPFKKGFVAGHNDRLLLAVRVGINTTFDLERLGLASDMKTYSSSGYERRFHIIDGSSLFEQFECRCFVHS